MVTAAAAKNAAEQQELYLMLSVRWCTGAWLTSFCPLSFEDAKVASADSDYSNSSMMEKQQMYVQRHFSSVFVLWTTQVYI